MELPSMFHTTVVAACVWFGSVLFKQVIDREKKQQEEYKIPEIYYLARYVERVSATIAGIYGFLLFIESASVLLPISLP